MQLLLGFVLAALISGLAYWRGSLSKSGVLGALVVGMLIFGLGGWAWGVLLVAFFVSSSALSHYKESLKESLAEKFSKGHRRDWAQTLANGGAGMLAVMGHALWPHPMWWAAFVGAMATVNADTWATELGVLSKSPPRLVTTGKKVEVGTSGGITLVGTLAALSGAAVIAIVGSYFMGQLELRWTYDHWFFESSLGIHSDPPGPNTLFWNGFAHTLWVGTLSGFAASLLDSLLGATVQAIYFCEACSKETERHPAHTCGSPTRPLRGWRWLDNDWVNFLSSVAGAALAAGLWWLIS